MKSKIFCPACNSGFKIVRDHYTNQGLVCLKRNHKYTLCNACDRLVDGLEISTHCKSCGAIYELERSKNSIPGMIFKNPLGELHKKSFHERFK